MTPPEKGPSPGYTKLKKRRFFSNFYLIAKKYEKKAKNRPKKAKNGLKKG
jgi:hypothetical protein